VHGLQQVLLNFMCRRCCCAKCLNSQSATGDASVHDLQ
jgi:hypothetical protein